MATTNNIPTLKRATYHRQKESCGGRDVNIKHADGSEGKFSRLHVNDAFDLQSLDGFHENCQEMANFTTQTLHEEGACLRIHITWC